MKGYLLAAVFCFSWMICGAQRATVTAEKMNTLYIGVDNPLVAIAEKYPCQTLILKASRGKVEKLSDCRYNYTAPLDKSGQKEIISIYRMQGKDTIKIGESEFRIKHIPYMPIARIGGINGGIIKKDALKVQLGIAVNLDGFDYDCPCQVTSYELTMLKKSGKCTTLIGNSAYFTKEMKQLFETAEPSDQLIIFKILAEIRGEKNWHISPFELTIE